LVLGSYALISSGKLQPRSALYQGMNLVGAIGLAINSGWNGAWPSAGLNVVWLGIALVAMRRNRRRARP
jgi:Na+/proline symporter